MYTETIETKLVTEKTLDNMLADSVVSNKLKSILKNTIINVGLPIPVNEFKALLTKLMEKLEEK